MATEVEIKKPISYEILNEEDKVQFTFETVEGENLVKNPGSSRVQKNHLNMENCC